MDTESSLDTENKNLKEYARLVVALLGVHRLSNGKGLPTRGWLKVGCQ
jgi:hypothetical protein